MYILAIIRIFWFCSSSFSLDSRERIILGCILGPVRLRKKDGGIRKNQDTKYKLLDENGHILASVTRQLEKWKLNQDNMEENKQCNKKQGKQL